jgi:hypothetical protein
VALTHRHEARHEVVDRPMVDDRPMVVQEHDTAVQEEHDIAPGRMLATIAGAALTVIGAVVLVRTGIDGSLESPTTEFLGATHSAFAGIASVVCGILLLVAGASRDQTLAVLPGILLVGGGIFALAATTQLRQDLGVDDSTGWFMIVFGIIAFVCAAMPIARRSRYRRERMV